MRNDVSVLEREEGKRIKRGIPSFSELDGADRGYGSARNDRQESRNEPEMREGNNGIHAFQALGSKMECLSAMMLLATLRSKRGKE